jgi:hypothetical protein
VCGVVGGAGGVVLGVVGGGVSSGCRCWFVCPAWWVGGCPGRVCLAMAWLMVRAQRWWGCDGGVVVGFVVGGGVVW